MKIKKRIEGKDIILDYKRVKRYNGYILFNVYQCISKSKRKYLYKTCLTPLDIKLLSEKDFIISDEEVFE